MVWRVRSILLAGAIVLLMLGQGAAFAPAPSVFPAHGAVDPELSHLLASLDTHGPDPVPDGDEPWPEIDAANGGPVCATDPVTDHYARVVLMNPLPNLPGSVDAQTVANLAIAADAIVAAEAARFGRTIHLKVLCDLEGAIDVAQVVVSVDPPTADFLVLVAELAAQGYALPNVHYWVFFNGFVNGIGGQGSAPTEHEPVLDGGGNAGPGYAFTYGYQSPRIMLHELTHNMGAVSARTPNTSSGGHCNDGRDVMCYADGGSTSWYRGNVCAEYTVYDCNSDDYFHPNPAPDNYLWDHWNLASGLNQFIQHEEACQWVVDELPVVGTRDSDRVGIDMQRIALNDDCPGAFFTLDNNAPVRVARDRIHLVAGCFEKDAVELACYPAGIASTGTIPEDADAIRVWVEGDHGGGFRFMPN